MRSTLSLSPRKSLMLLAMPSMIGAASSHMSTNLL